MTTSLCWNRESGKKVESDRLFPPLKGDAEQREAGGCKKVDMKKNEIIPYNPKLKSLARKLRNNSTRTEIILWNKIKRKSLGVEFHRQVPINEYIVDFFCHELLLAIEIDGSTHYYNFDYDEDRQVRMEKLGIKFIRFDDRDVRYALNDVVRAIELTIEELVEEEKKHPPCPPSKGDG